MDEQPNPEPLSRRVPAGTNKGKLKCHRCDYSLQGQPIFRDIEYGFHLTQCPECGTWVSNPADQSRRPFLAHLGWLHSLWRLVLVLGIAAFIGGMAQSTGYAAVLPQAQTISLKYNANTAAGSGWTWGYHRVSRVWWTKEWEAGSVFRSPLSSPGLFDWTALTDWIWIATVTPILSTLMFAAFERWPKHHIVQLGAVIVGLGALGFAVHLVIIAVDPWPYVINVAELTMGVWFSTPTLILGGVFFVLYLSRWAEPTLLCWRRVFRT